MSQPVDAVVGGSNAFVEAVKAHLELRLGGVAQVARDPQQLVDACASPHELLVVEYAGPTWGEALNLLLEQNPRNARWTIAAIHQAQAGESVRYQKAGANEVVGCNGQVDSVLRAIERAVRRLRPVVEAGPATTPVPSRSHPLAPARDQEVPVLSAAAAKPPPGAASPPPVSPKAVARTTGQAPPSRSSGVAEASAPATRSGASSTSSRKGIPWPQAIPGTDDAGQLMEDAVVGRAIPHPYWRSLTERVLAGVSDLERDAVAGRPVPVDPAPLRSAAALRLQLEAAISTAPPPGSAIDEAGAQQLISEVDGVLSQLKLLDPGQPAVHAELQTIKGQLIDAGVRLGALLGQILGQTSSAAEVVPVPHHHEEKSITRVLSNQSVDEARPRVRRGEWIALAIVLAIGVGYHVWRHASARAPMPLPTVAGAPDNTYVVKQPGSNLLMVRAGKSVDPKELERFRGQEQAKGYTVREISPGVWSIEPMSPASGGGKP